jgi:hypothetical protein
VAKERYVIKMVERSNLTVLLDMDGVLFDFDGEVQTRLQAEHPDIRPMQLNPPNFYTANNYPEEHQDKVWAISNERGFVAALPLVPDAVNGFGRVLEAGFNAQICSTLLPEVYSPHCREEKIAALEEHFVPRFGGWVVETALFTPDKHLADGMALIDDKPPPIKHSERAVWEHVVFDRACNRTESSEGYLRLRGWADPNLPDILEEAKKRHLFKMSNAG